MLTLEVQRHPQVTVLRFSGRIVRGDGAGTLLRLVMSRTEPYLQIDLSQVRAIDASGLGVLVELEKWAKDENRTLQVTNPSKRVREAIETTQLGAVLQVCPAVQQRGHAA